MTEVSAAGFLGLWERVAAEPPGRRASLLLAWAQPGTDPSGVTAGQENDRLLQVYRRAFGAALSGVVDCPGCGEPLDVTLAVDDLLAGLAAAGPDPGPDTPGGEHEAAMEGYRLRYRVPSARDLATPPRSGLWLLASCLVSAVGPDGDPIGAEGLPDSVVAALEQAMATLDPGAELSLNLACPACERAWTEYLDPVEFLSVEVEARARDALDAVHTLAVAYGWSESEILSLTPWRLQRYLAAAAR